MSAGGCDGRPELERYASLVLEIQRAADADGTVLIDVPGVAGEAFVSVVARAGGGHRCSGVRWERMAARLASGMGHEGHLGAGVMAGWES